MADNLPVTTKNEGTGLKKFGPKTADSEDDLSQGTTVKELDRAKNLLDGTLDALVKIANISTDTKGKKGNGGKDIAKNVAKVSKMITSGYSEIVKSLVSTSQALATNDITKLIEWKDSGETEFLMGTDPNDGLPIVRTRKEINEMTGEEESVKIQNPKYYKPHFAAEENILKIGDFISKLVQPIQKVAGMDLEKLPNPRKIGKQMNQLAGSMSAMVKSLVKSFSNIDTSGSDKALELLMGNQGTESVVEKINSYNAQSESEKLSETNSSKETITAGKKASVIDVVGSFLDACNKVTAFEFKTVIKKSMKFKGMVPVLGKTFRGVVRSMYGMIPSEQELNYDDATRRIQALNKFIADFNEKAFTNIVSIKIPIDKLYKKRTDLRRAKNILSGFPFGGILGLIDDICAAFAAQAGQGGEEKKEASTEEAGVQLVEGTGEATNEIVEKENGRPTKPSDFQQGVKIFKDKVATIEDVLKTVISAKMSSKEARKSLLGFIGARHAINRAIALSQWIEKRMSSIDSTATKETTEQAKNLSDSITAVEPAIRAMSVIALISEYTGSEGIDSTKYTICAFADSVEYLSKKEINFENIQAIQDGMSDTLKSIIKFMLLSKLVSDDKQWIDDMFSNDGAMTKFIDAVSKVYAQFEARQMQEPETMEKICECLNSLDESIDSMAKILMSARLLSVVAAVVDVDALSKRTLGSEGPVIVLIESVRGVLDSLEKNNLDEEGIKKAKNSIDDLGEVTRSLIGIMLGARILSSIANSAKNADGEKSKKLLDVLMTPINELGKEETYDTIKRSLKSVLLLSLELLILTGVLVLVGITVSRNAMQVLLGIGLIALMALGSILIMQELAEFKDSGQLKDGALAMLMIAGSFIAFSLSILLLGLVGDLTLKSMLMFVGMVLLALGVLWLVGKISEKSGGALQMCLPLLVIGGSFVLFALSLLVLSLVEDVAWSALLKFVLMVGLALGVMWLLDKMKSTAVKGAIVLMVTGAAFMFFSVVLLILSRISEDADVIEILALVGVIAALIGVAMLAGLGIIPLLAGSLGLIVLGVALLVFSVALSVLFGIGKLLGDDIEGTITPIVDTISFIVSKLKDIPIMDVLSAMAVAVLSMVMVTTLTITTLLIVALEKIAPKPDEVEQVKMAMCGIAASLKAITDKMNEIGIGEILKAMIVSIFALVMLVPLSIVALILLGFSRMRIATEFDDKNKPVKWESLNGSSFDRVGEMMVGLVGAIHAVTDAMDEIGLGTAIKALVVSVLVLSFMVPLSIVALILLGFSRLRIATEFDDENKPVKWESLDGSSFDRVGDTMVNMVEAIIRTADAINEISIIGITKAMIKSVEILAMMAALSGVLALLANIGTKRVPVEWNEKNEPTKYEDFGDDMIKAAVATTTLLVKSVKDMAVVLAEYDTEELKKAKKNAKLMRGIIKPIGSLLDLIMRLTEGPISFGPCDEEGNPTGEEKQMKGSLGDYLKTHNKQVTDNIDSLIGVFDLIAKKVSEPNGIGNVDSKTLKRARRNIGRVGEITKALKPGIDIIQSLTSGSFNIGTEENPQNVNLGDFLTAKRPEVEKNLTSLFEFVEFIGDKAVAYYQKGEPKDTGVAGFFKRGWSRLKSLVGTDDISMGAKKIGRVGEVMSALSPAIDLIQAMSEGEYTMMDSDGTEKKVSLGEWIRSNKKPVQNVLDDLFGFVEHVGDCAAAYYAKGQTQESGVKGWFKRWQERRQINNGTDDISMGAKKIGRVGEIMNALNPALDLIVRLSSGEYEIPDPDKPNSVIKVSLGEFIRKSKPKVQETLTDLFEFLEFISDEMKERFGYDPNENFSDRLNDSLSMSSAISHCKMINEAVSPILGIIEVVEKVAGGVIETVDSKGKKMKVNLHTFITDNMPKVKETIYELINFLMGPDGLVETLSIVARLDDEKYIKTVEQKFGIKYEAGTFHNTLLDNEKKKDKSLLDSMLKNVTDFVGSLTKIIESTKKLSEVLYSKEVEKLFSMDPKTNLKGKMMAVFTGLDIPLDDSMIFAHTEQFSVRYDNLARYNDLLKSMMKTENVDNWRKTVDATGDMVNSINSINDTKIDKLNTLMVNMQKFGETLDEALKDVFDKVVELAEELHYIIEADMKKNNPEEYKRMKQQEQRSANPLSPKNNQQQQPANIQQHAQNSSTDLTTVENQLRDVIEKLEYIASK